MDGRYARFPGRKTPEAGRLFMKAIILAIAIMFPTRAFAADMLSVAARQVNVRSGPGSEYTVVWQAVRYYPLQVIDTDGSWIMVSDYGNDEGWIYKSLLSETPAVVVVSENANIREGPGMDYEALWVAEKEYSLKVIDTEGDWYKVSNGGAPLGWIHKSVTWGFSVRPQLARETPL